MQRVIIVDEEAMAAVEKLIRHAKGLLPHVWNQDAVQVVQSLAKQAEHALGMDDDTCPPVVAMPEKVMEGRRAVCGEMCNGGNGVHVHEPAPCVIEPHKPGEAHAHAAPKGRSSGHTWR